MASSSEQTTPTHLLNILVTGPHGVGKSSIFDFFLNGINEQSPKAPTYFGVRTIKFSDKQTVRFKVFDPEKPPSPFQCGLYYAGAHGIIIVFDVTDKESYDAAKVQVTRIRREMGDKQPQLMLIGNKIDLENRAVGLSEAYTYALDNNLLYTELSAKSDPDCADNAFTTLGIHILRKNS